MKLQCPRCGESDLATVEVIIAIARFTGFDGVEFQYENTYWNESVTITNAKGHPHLHCLACDHEWYELSVRVEVKVEPYTLVQNLAGRVPAESVEAREFLTTADVLLLYLASLGAHEIRTDPPDEGKPGQDGMTESHWRMGASFWKANEHYQGAIFGSDLKGPATGAVFTPASFMRDTIRARHQDGVWTLQEG